MYAGHEERQEGQGNRYAPDNSCQRRPVSEIQSQKRDVMGKVVDFGRHVFLVDIIWHDSTKRVKTFHSDSSSGHHNTFSQVC